jgi:hypothetical protein
MTHVGADAGISGMKRARDSFIVRGPAPAAAADVQKFAVPMRKRQEKYKLHIRLYHPEHAADRLNIAD